MVTRWQLTVHFVRTFQELVASTEETTRRIDVKIAVDRPPMWLKVVGGRERARPFFTRICWKIKCKLDPPEILKMLQRGLKGWTLLVLKHQPLYRALAQHSGQIQTTWQSHGLHLFFSWICSAPPLSDTNCQSVGLVGTRVHVFPEAGTRSTLAGAPQWRAKCQCTAAITSSCNVAINGNFFKFPYIFCNTITYMQLWTGWGIASGTHLESLWTKINSPHVKFYHRKSIPN